ncbi:MAG: methyltransferase domain-containing protein [Candidatus Omnitrophica bacterium]|nr:methyltransferase domain-containing protein [Candidatus Omnitrophota bacterium]
MKRLFALILTLSLIPSQESYSQTSSATSESQIPPPLTHYMGREIAQTMHYSGAEWLIRETREKEESTQRFLKELRVEKGWTVCDLGCGNGYYSLPLARMVGEKGKVIGVDIQPEMLQMLMDRAKQRGIDNIEPTQGSVIDPNLEPNSIDLMILVDVYHEFSHPEQMLARIRESLKPTGQIALLEFRAEDPEVPIKPEHKMSKAQIMKEYTANGFELAREFNDLPWQHLMFFKRAGKGDNGSGQN